MSLLIWMNSFQTIHVMSNDDNLLSDNGRFAISKLSSPDVKYDEIFDSIWKMVHDKNDQPFDSDTFIQLESNMGRKIYEDNKYKIIPNGMIQNSLFAKKVAYLHDVDPLIHQFQKTRELSTSFYNYTPSMCQADSITFNQWETQHPVWSNAPHSEGEGVKYVLEGQIKQCIEYNQYVWNMPVSISDANLIQPLEMLLRKQKIRDRRRRMREVRKRQ